MPSPEEVLLWYQENFLGVAGLDEAGRGPLAGPVVAAAVVLDLKKPINGLNDSKKLTEQERERLFRAILGKARGVAISAIPSEQIDQSNILKASLLAMAQSFASLEAQLGPLAGALVDGNKLAPLRPGIIQHAVVSGDALVPAIMAASIMAKVTRDRIMVEAAAQYPGYGFENHKGYGTKEHLDAIRRLGPCPIHRMTYNPVRFLELDLG